MIQEIIGQLIGIVAPILTIITYQLNTKNKMFTVLTAATVCTCVSYLLLGATSGFVLNIVCIVRNICYCLQKEGTRGMYISGGIFAAVMCALGAFSWQGTHSLLIIAALAINTVYMSFGKPQLLRKSILLTSTLVLIYNIIEFSLGGIINESLALGSAVVGIVRFWKEPKKNN
ncbi:MAG: YgjV family protein [Clostridia bacterium]|nr:YgjV family protein [Clostridia bacterium]